MTPLETGTASGPSGPCIQKFLLCVLCVLCVLCASARALVRLQKKENGLRAESQRAQRKTPGNHGWSAGLQTRLDGAYFEVKFHN